MEAVEAQKLYTNFQEIFWTCGLKNIIGPFSNMAVFICLTSQERRCCPVLPHFSHEKKKTMAILLLLPFQFSVADFMTDVKCSLIRLK